MNFQLNYDKMVWQVDYLNPIFVWSPKNNFTKGQDMTSTLRVSQNKLEKFIYEAFLKTGLPDADARTMGALMAEADLQGSDGHGVIRMVPYITRFKGGGVNLKPNIRVVKEKAAMALIDGDNGMGHLVMKQATELAESNLQTVTETTMKATKTASKKR